MIYFIDYKQYDDIIKKNKEWLKLRGKGMSKIISKSNLEIVPTVVPVNLASSF